MVHSAVDAAMMLAAMQHFSLCDKARDATWSEPEIFISGNPYHFDFVKAALDHAVTCTDAQPLNIRTNPFANSQEPVMATTAEEPEPQPIRVPALNLSCTDHVEGVILTVDHDGETHSYDLVQVVERIPHMQFRRYDTVRLTTVAPVDPTEWDLAIGTELTLYAVTGNGQFLVIGDYAYDYATVKDFLRTHGSKLELSSSDYTPPPWVIQHTASQHALAQGELNAEGGQLLPDRTHGVDTGLTELPDPETPFAEDPEYGDCDTAAEDELEHTEYLMERDGIWPSLRRYWIVTTLGLIAGIFNAGTITFGTHHHFSMIWSVVIGLVTSVNITCGAGVLGSLVATRTFSEPELTSDEHQAWIFHGGAIIGWMLLVLVDLAFLL